MSPRLIVDVEFQWFLDECRRRRAASLVSPASARPSHAQAAEAGTGKGGSHAHR